MAQGGPALIQQRVGPFAYSPHSSEQGVVGAVVSSEAPGFDRVVDPDPALVTLVREDQHACCGHRIQRAEAVLPGRR